MYAVAVTTSRFKSNSFDPSSSRAFSSCLSLMAFHFDLLTRRSFVTRYSYVLTGRWSSSSGRTHRASKSRCAIVKRSGRGLLGGSRLCNSV